MIIIETVERGCTPRHHPTVPTGSTAHENASRRSPRRIRRPPPPFAIERRRGGSPSGQIAVSVRALRHPRPPQRWYSRAPLPQSHDTQLARRARRPHAIRSAADLKSP
jgi:hypothetical protein